MKQSIQEIEMQLESIQDDRLEIEEELAKAMKVHSDSIKTGTYENCEDVLDALATMEWAVRRLREAYVDSHTYHKERLEIDKELEEFKASPECQNLRFHFEGCAWEAAALAENGVSHCDVCDESTYTSTYGWCTYCEEFSICKKQDEAHSAALLYNEGCREHHYGGFSVCVACASKDGRCVCPVCNYDFGVCE